jgi:glycosyltransferase involved in cell wall biosynthesis
MKNILLMMYYMNCGGVETAIIELIKHIDPTAYHVDLLMVEQKGEFLNRIPSWVNVKALDMSELEKKLVLSQSICDTVRYGLKHGHVFTTMWLTIKYLYQKVVHCSAPAYCAVFGSKKKFRYDLALDFHGYASLTTYFISENVEASKKYTWVHSEPIAEHLDCYSKYLRNYDGIFCVSRRCEEKAKKSLPPELKEKVKIFKNFIDVERVLSLAQVGPRLPEFKSGLKILTVGRLSTPKGYDIAIQVAYALKNSGLKFKWYFCGEGEEREKLHRSIIEMGLNDVIVMMGYQNNPYGYMDSCDIYVQSSRWEGYAVTLVEASIIGCPLVSTDVAGAREEIRNRENGFIAEVDAEKLTNAVLCMANDPVLRTRIWNCKSERSDLNKQSKTMLALILDEGENNVGS